MHPDRHHGSEIESLEMSDMIRLAAGKLTCECFFLNVVLYLIIFADCKYAMQYLLAYV